mmetsp:Transcript_15986/g.42230  ORF Transcript_15986/g.42230 Transcript_15986/m.42230 type:complete len:214 (+) Transcript_15986:248-889(+)
MMRALGLQFVVTKSKVLRTAQTVPPTPAPAAAPIGPKAEPRTAPEPAEPKRPAALGCTGAPTLSAAQTLPWSAAPITKPGQKAVVTATPPSAAPPGVRPIPAMSPGPPAVRAICTIRLPNCPLLAAAVFIMTVRTATETPVSEVATAACNHRVMSSAFFSCMSAKSVMVLMSSSFPLFGRTCRNCFMRNATLSCWSFTCSMAKPTFTNLSCDH